MPDDKPTEPTKVTETVKQTKTTPEATTTTTATTATTSGKPKTNGLAIAALILAFLFPIVGLILGIVALTQIKKSNEGGRGLAVASIVISIIMMVMAVLIVFVTFLAVGNLAKQSGVNYDAGKGTVSVTDKEGNTGSFGNSVSLPSGFPSDVPIYKPSTIRLAVKSKDNAYNVTFTSKDSPESINQWYESELSKQGWSSANSSSIDLGVGKTQSFTKGDQQLVYVIYGDKTQYSSDEKTMVSLTVATQEQ